MTWLVVLPAVAVVVVLATWAVGRVRPADTSPFEAAVAAASSDTVVEVPPGLVEAGQLVRSARTQGGWHHRLRPVLVEMTDARLRDRHGIDLSHPDAPRRVGEPLWSLVRPDAPEPADRGGPGIAPDVLAAALDRWTVL